MKNMSIFVTMRKVLVALSAAAVLLIAGCRPAMDLSGLSTDTFYEASVDGGRQFFCVTSLSKEGVEGYYYSVADAPDAPRREFSAAPTRKGIELTADGRQLLLDAASVAFHPYVEPEFSPQRTGLFLEPQSEVVVTKDIVYARAKGYWQSLPGVEADVSKAFTSGYIKSFKRRDVDLTMDIYRPEDAESPRPLILFLHGGAFYVGDKQEPAYVDFCTYFASRGYVTASMNYRMGFHVGKGEIERAGYVAVQDAHAAMRFLVAHAADYGIDPDQLYVAGSSAGSITALNLAFMTEADRPASSHGGKSLLNNYDLGRIDGSGNDIKADFHIRAVANMWGAISSLDMLSRSRTSIISFHGDADNVVPYAEGYPFSSIGDFLAQSLSDVMFGSVCIDSAARARGLRSEMNTFKGCGHALNTTGKEKTPNANHDVIKKKITSFFYREMVPVAASIKSLEGGQYVLSGEVETLQWKVEGGFVLDMDEKTVAVLWRSDADDRSLTASGTYPGGIGYLVKI